MGIHEIMNRNIDDYQRSALNALNKNTEEKELSQLSILAFNGFMENLCLMKKLMFG